MPKTSVRELARSLGLSHTTVSEALRNCPRVREATRQRVLEAAQNAGYRYNPLAGALMSEMRRSRAGAFRGVLAVVDLDSPDVRAAGANNYHREVASGASESAVRLGFKLEPFVLGRDHLSVSRLDTILKSRGIRGLLVLPSAKAPDLAGLDWSHFAGVYTDYIIESPALDSVCSDHFRSMVLAMQRLSSLGYQRPGLMLTEAHDSRLLFRWEAAFRSYHQHHDCFEFIEPLIAPELSEAAFRKWFAKAKPDVVLCHNWRVLEWMEAAGANVPTSHGFCGLNVTMSQRPVSGLNLQPRLIGSRALELIVAQLHRNEYGVPATASTTTIPAAWTEGPTLRSLPAKR
jgi:LacI family transcriptional regulator